MNNYKCTFEMHLRCANNFLCHLCDGSSLFHDPIAKKREAEKQRELRIKEEKDALVRPNKKERKKGMAFEKRVADQWNSYSKKNKKKPKKPRIELPDEMKAEEVVHPATPQPSAKKKPREEARRQINSGAFWHSKGDIKLEHALMECKERGTTNSRGEKQITIQKAWLEKQEKEAFQEGKYYWYLSFGFKGDDRVYLIKPYEHEIELIHEYRKLREELERLQTKLDEIGKGESDENS